MLMRSGITGKSGITRIVPFGRSPRAVLLSRRRFFTLTALVGLSAGATACTAPPVAAPIPLEPDELSVSRAVASARTLRAEALALAEDRPELAGQLDRVAAVHEEHLVALGSPINAATASASAADPTTSEPTASAPSAPTAAGMVKAETAAARTALRDGLAAAPAFAVLLCRIAAARGVNADLIAAAAGRAIPGALRPARADAPTGSASASASASVLGPEDDAASDPIEAGPTDDADLVDPATPAQVALDRLLAGQHAAVFTYPLIVARVTGNRRAQADDLWQQHRSERDELSARLLAGGIRPAVAEPAYDVGVLPSGASKAAALAARIELGLAALATDLLAAAADSAEASSASDPSDLSDPDQDRLLGADQLVLAARRNAAWTRRPLAFPGLIAASAPAAPGSSTTGSSTPSGNPS